MKADLLSWYCKLEYLPLRSVQSVACFCFTASHRLLYRMGRSFCSHGDAKVWKASRPLLVSGEKETSKLGPPNLSVFVLKVLALAFMIGCTFAPTLKTFTGKLKLVCIQVAK